MEKILKNSASSVLTETEEPAVLTPFSGTGKEPEPKFPHFYGTEENRNRDSEPRVTETAVFGKFLAKINQNLLL